MKQFSVGATPSTVEVYVHNYHEHFQQTIERMSIAERVQSVHIQASTNIQKAMQDYRKTVGDVEQDYLNLVMGPGATKEDYRKMYLQNTKLGDSKVKEVVNMFTEMSPGDLNSLKKTMENYKKSTTTFTRQEALSHVLDYSQEATKSIGDLISTISEENMRASHKDFSETNVEAIKKRKKLAADIAEELGNENSALAQKLKTVKTLGQLKSYMTDIRKHYLGEVFEILVAMNLGDFHRMFVGEMMKLKDKKIPGMSFTIVGDVRDAKKDDLFTTDFITRLGAMKIGVDVKSSSHLYGKSTQSVGSQYTLMANILLDKTKFKDFFGNLNASDPELLKEIAYILTNMTVFQQTGDALKVTDKVKQLEESLKFLTMLTGIMDFLMTYVKTFNNIYRKQILVIAGNDVFFLTDLIDMLISMVQQLKFGDKRLFGSFTEYKAETTGRVDLNAHKNLLGEKREVMAKDTIKYAALFSHLRSGTMKTIATTALERTTKISIRFNPSQQFKKVGSII